MTTASQVSPTRVLVVDDDDEIRNLLRRSLLRAGFEVVGEAPNGSDGAQLAGVLQPDVVILDSEMPVMDGEGSAVLIREQAPQAIIVAFSGQLRSCPAWADAYLNKGSGGLIQNLVTVVGLATLGTEPSRG